MFSMAGIGVHNGRNPCSASVGIGVHVRPEWAFRMGRNTHIAGLDCWQRSVDVKEALGYLAGELALHPNLTGGRILNQHDFGQMVVVPASSELIDTLRVVLPSILTSQRILRRPRVLHAVVP
jgi:hypothetical protein